MQLLSRHQLDAHLQNVVLLSKSLHSVTFHLFTIMYNFGLRRSEVCQFTRWSVVADNIYQVFLEKKSGTRIIDLTSQSSDLQSFIKSSVINSATFSSSLLSRDFNRLSSISNFKISNKSTTCHLFRHNFIKKLFYDQNHTHTQIATILSERYADNILSYITSQITY